MDIITKFFIVGVLKHGNKLLREVVDVLEEFKARLAGAPNNLV